MGDSNGLVLRVAIFRIKYLKSNTATIHCSILKKYHPSMREAQGVALRLGHISGER
jgi:hypothetical protein